MMQELVYTSAPRGLKAGASGFCTVASTPGMSATLAQLLEGLSAYRHAVTPGPEPNPANPVVYSHWSPTVGGKRVHILSRIADAGLDYSGRSNKIAHHLVLDSVSDLSAGPAWYLAQESLWIRRWDGQPQTLPMRTLPPATQGPAVPATWKRLAGDAGWAGKLVEAAHEHSVCFVVVDPNIDALTLVREALALTPLARRWSVTFSTYLTRQPPDECLWRFVLVGTPEALAARRNPQSRIIDLTRPLPTATGPFCELARQGQVCEVQRVPAAVSSQAGSGRVATPPGNGGSAWERLPGDGTLQSGPADSDLRLGPPSMPRKGFGVRGPARSTQSSVPNWTFFVMGVAVALLLAAVALTWEQWRTLAGQPSKHAPPPMQKNEGKAQTPPVQPKPNASEPTSGPAGSTPSDPTGSNGEGAVKPGSESDTPPENDPGGTDPSTPSEGANSVSGNDSRPSGNAAASESDSDTSQTREDHTSGLPDNVAAPTENGNPSSVGQPTGTGNEPGHGAPPSQVDDTSQGEDNGTHEPSSGGDKKGPNKKTETRPAPPVDLNKLLKKVEDEQEKCAAFELLPLGLAPQVILSLPIDARDAKELVLSLESYDKPRLKLTLGETDEGGTKWLVKDEPGTTIGTFGLGPCSGSDAGGRTELTFEWDSNARGDPIVKLRKSVLLIGVQDHKEPIPFALTAPIKARSLDLASKLHSFSTMSKDSKTQRNGDGYLWLVTAEDLLPKLKITHAEMRTPVNGTGTLEEGGKIAKFKWPDELTDIYVEQLKEVESNGNPIGVPPNQHDANDKYLRELLSDAQLVLELEKEGIMCVATGPHTKKSDGTKSKSQGVDEKCIKETLERAQKHIEDKDQVTFAITIVRKLGRWELPFLQATDKP